MKKLLTLLTTASILLTISGCGAETEEEIAEETTEPEEILEEIDYSQEILGTWYFVLIANSGMIEGPAVFWPDGTITGEYGDVTTPEASAHVLYPEGTEGEWAVDGMSVYMTGGQGMWGAFIDEENMAGSIIDMEGVEAYWTAYKLADLPVDITGLWMASFPDGLFEGEYARHQLLAIRDDGSVTSTYIKIQDGSASVSYESYDDEPFGTYEVDGNNVTITSEDGSVIMEVTLEDGDTEIEGTWTNADTGESGTWYGTLQAE